MLKCQICGIEKKNLTRHIIENHNMSTADYKKIFNVKFVREDSWNRDKKGLQTAWNKNLTKETDERVANYAQKAKENPLFKRSYEEKYGKEKADEMKRNVRLTHTGRKATPKQQERYVQASLKREAEWRESGRKKEITEKARQTKWKSTRDKISFREWTKTNFKDALYKRANNRCELCGAEEGKPYRFEIHHKKYKFPITMDDLMLVCMECHQTRLHDNWNSETNKIRLNT